MDFKVSKRLWLGASLLFMGGLFNGTTMAQSEPNSPAVLGAGNTVDASREAFNDEDSYVWHSSASSSATYSGTGSSTWRYNSTGEDIVVTQTGSGTYTVDFGSTRNFIPTVTSYDAAIHCNVEIFSFPGSAVFVACYDFDGNPKDARFTVRLTSTLEDAAAWVSGAGNPCCTNNPWGGALTAARNSVGNYTVTTPGGPNFEGGHIQVTAYNTENHCKVNFWGGSTANVLCFNNDGLPVDNAFTFLRVGSNDDAYVWADNSSSTTSYTPPTFFSHNPQGADPTAIKNSTGQYEVTFPGLLVEYGGNIQVSAYGPSSSLCTVVSWSSTEVDVNCTDVNGNQVDSQFDVLFTRFQTCAGLPANIEIGNNDATSGDDIIVGTGGSDSISGLGGDDIICGMNGFDTIRGGAGEDVIYGGDENGNDDSANDLFGGTGDDELYGSDNNDFLFGQGGADILVTNDVTSGFSDIMSGGSGDDTLTSNSLFGTDMRGNGNNDKLFGSTVADFMRGDPGLDLIEGFGGDDEIQGGLGADELFGGNGADFINGQGSRDVIFGEAGADTILGGPGNDQINGGSGFDFCNGQGQTGGAGDTQINCESSTGFPRAPSKSLLNIDPSRVVFSDDELRILDNCDLTIDQCLGR